MSLYHVYSFVCALWFIAEFVWARIATGVRSQGLDRDSLGILWVTMLLSIVVGSAARKLNIANWQQHKHVLLLAATVLVVIGAAIRFLSILTLKKFFTVRVTILGDHQLIRRGLYAHIRHPSYLGALISFFGVGLGMCNGLSLLIVFLPILGAFLYRIHVEEHALQQRFGYEYAAYRASTKRLIPWIY
jgi:protein-S-isoprenylcysteine O-methyltransferase Ste14